MKAILFLAVLMPLTALAQPLNTTNNPNQPGYVIPASSGCKTRCRSSSSSIRAC